MSINVKRISELMKRAVFGSLALIFLPCFLLQPVKAQNLVDEVYDNVPYEISRKHFDRIWQYTICAAVQVVNIRNSDFSTDTVEQNIFLYLDGARAYHRYYYPDTTPSSFHLVYTLTQVMATHFQISDENNVDFVSFCEETVKPELTQWLKN